MAELPAPEPHLNGGGTVAPNNPSEPTGSKRHRRPSVRLGDIGDQPNDPLIFRRYTATKPWRPSFPNASGKPSKTRPLTNLTEFGEFREGSSAAVGSWKVKDSKKKVSSSSSAAANKRPRSNWVASSRIDEGDDVDDGNQDFDSESPVHSVENLGGDAADDDDYREVLQNYHHEENGGRLKHGENGVRIWLNGLGLSRYGPVFEIHEVDDEVLPLLTLEDLKDMGINAVGSRRKLYCAIQKLGNGFS